VVEEHDPTREARRGQGPLRATSGTASDREPRAKLVIWCDDDQDPDTFYLFEIYANREEQLTNADAPWFAEYLAAAAPLLTPGAEFVSATPRWSTGFPIT
jgi:hypothetical protein